MITKTGQRLIKQAALEKRAIDPLTALAWLGEKALVAATGHVIQNIAGKTVLNNPQKTGVLQMMMRGIARPKQGMSTLGGNVAYGAAEGAMPEIGMLYHKASDLGKHLERTLAKQNLTMDTLPRRHKVALSLAAQGRFRDAYRIANTPQTRDVLNAYMSKIMPGTEHVMGSAPAISGQAGPNALARLRKELPDLRLDQETINGILGDLEKAYQETSIGKAMSSALKSDGKQMLDKALAGMDTRLNRWARNGTRYGVRAGLAEAEPAMAGLNEFKRFMEWKEARKVPGVAKAQDWATKKFVTDPLKENFQKGLEGQESVTYSRQAKKDAIQRALQTEGKDAARNVAKQYNNDLVDTYVVNPFSNEMSHMANKAGLALHKAGITPERLEKLKAMGDDFRSGWEATDKEYRIRTQAQKILDAQAQAAAKRRQNQIYVNNNLKYQQTGMPVAMDAERQKLLGNSLYDFRPASMRIF